MHQTSTGTKKKQKKQNFQQLPRSGPIVPGNFSFFFFFGACRCFLNFHFVFFVFFGACAGLVTLTSQNIDRHQKNQKNQTTRCTKHRQAPKKQKKTKFPATTQKWAHSSWKFCFFCFFWCLSMFPQLSLCFFCFFWCLCRFGDSDFTKH